MINVLIKLKFNRFKFSKGKALTLNGLKIAKVPISSEDFELSNESVEL